MFLIFDYRNATQLHSGYCCYHGWLLRQVVSPSMRVVEVLWNRGHSIWS